MKYNLILCTALMLTISQASNAQFFNKLKKKAEAAVNDAIDGKPVNTPKVATKQPAQNTTPQPTQQAAPQANTEATTPAAPALTSYTKYDFVPGQTVIYSDNFATDAAGELPAGWNSNGNGAITRLNSFEGNWMRMDQQATYLPGKELASTDNFTLEFDLVLDLKSNGYGFPEFRFGMISTGKVPVGDNSLLSDQKGAKSFEVEISPSTNSSTSQLRFTSDKGRTSYFRSPVKSLENFSSFYGKVSHVAVQGQKERLRLWVNGDKIIDVPKAIPAGDILNQLFFVVGSSNYTNSQLGIYVGNIKVAQGAADLRNKLINEGHFSTTGILFDVNAATIKPESSGTLQEIAQVLKDNPTINITITGHTDSDGNAAANQKLSLSRAESVKNTFVSTYGIDEARLKIAGKGATVPVASNKTETGKAQNRRVEFTKI
ncbi:hypothetical protein GCM10023149_01040 [Mucilaginibacter gynuensis]|uniref:OmpA-like domain-containing protein n=1 Tax=Mucilaginibacter gynuensis TaxID=1302236 RepID=A0ABP8FMV9_9SPHI